MAQLRDLTEFFDPDLHLPIDGKDYRIPAVSKDEADRLARLLVDKTLTEAQEKAEREHILGPALEQMKAAGLPDPVITHAGRTAIFHYGGGPKLGASHWHLSQLGELVDVDALVNEAQKLRQMQAAASVLSQSTPNRQQRRRRRR